MRMTDWRQYDNLHLAKLKAVLANRRLLDSRNIWRGFRTPSMGFA
jgi:hypothetical protein